MTSLILDIETLARTPDAVITEIALLVFSVPQFDVVAELTLKPNILDQIEKFRNVEPETIAFHRSKGSLPQAIGDLSPESTIQAMKAFIAEHNPRHVWIQGPDFDGPIIENICTQFVRPIIENFCQQSDQPLPWEYWRTRDARTAWDLAFPGVKHAPRPHRAIEDCRATLTDLSASLRTLNRTSAA